MLHLLQDYAEREGLDTTPGLATKRIAALLQFTPDGAYLGVLVFDKPKATPGCPNLSQPEIKGGGAGCRHFLADVAEVVTLLGAEALDDKARGKLEAKHAFFTGLLRQAAEAGALSELAPIVEALSDPSTRERIAAELAEKRVKTSDNVTFAIPNRTPARLVEDRRWHPWWQEWRAGLAQAKAKKKAPAKKSAKAKAAPAAPSAMRDLLTGELAPPTATHDKITGLSDVGGLAMGDNLVSFKQGAFRSYGLEQSANAAMSADSAKVYSSALNHLIAHRARRFQGIKVLFWYDGEVPADLSELIENPETEDDGFWDLCGGKPEVPAPPPPDPKKDAEAAKREKLRAESRAIALLGALRHGGEKARTDLRQTRYHSLTISGQSGRVMVRDFTSGQFGELREAILAWFEDLAIVHREGDRLASPPKFYAVLGATVRELKELASPDQAALWNAAICRRPISDSLFIKALARLRAEMASAEPPPPNQARMGLLKAYLNRLPEHRLTTPKETNRMQTHLHKNHPAPAYHCGRLLSVLADLQYCALGKVEAGVVQRFYGAASTTPHLVLGRLFALHHHHLNKISGNARDGYKQAIECILAYFPGQQFPTSLSLPEQALFALGYYQQSAHDRAARAEASARAKDRKASSTPDHSETTED
ncbi:MAG: type I-C CRISPR-associated protein Cas8c/Csd1 [Sumerlaeia bacterium]